MLLTSPVFAQQANLSITADAESYGVGTFATYTFGEKKRTQLGHLGIKQPGIGWDKFVGKSFWYSREVAKEGAFSGGVEGLVQRLPRRTIVGAGVYGQVNTDYLNGRMTWVKPTNINAPQYVLVGGNVNLERTIELTGLNVPKIGSIGVNGFVNIGEKSEQVLDQRGVRIGRVQYKLPFNFGGVQPLLEYNYQGPAKAHSYAAGVAIDLSRKNKRK